MTMNSTTAMAEAAMAIMPCRIESAPSEGPTVRSSSTVTGAGSAPARSTMARSRASSTVNWPVIPARPTGMRSLIRGADWSTPSSTIARWRPTFCSVISPKIRAPLAVNSMDTCQLPGAFGSGLTSARVSSAPVRSVRFWTTYGILRSTLVCLSTRRWKSTSSPSGTRPCTAASTSAFSSASLNSRSAVLPMSALARSGSCTPGSWIRIRSSPCRVMVGSATPNWSTRLRIVSTPWRTASSRSRATARDCMVSLKRPAAWSSSLRSNDWNSLATVSASFHDCGEARSTTIQASPSRATRRAAIPRRSSAALKSSAARSVWLATCLSVSTPSKRWMPPCRSRPRLIAFFGGYRYQREPRRTTRTTAARGRRVLGILVDLHLHDAPDGAPFELELHLVGDAEGDGLVGEVGDGAEHPARRDDLDASLDRGQHPLALMLLLLLGPDHEEVEDGEHRAEHHQRGHQLRAAATDAARRRRHRPCDVGEEEAHRPVRIPDSP